MQNLQREYSHSFLKKTAFRVGPRPLETRKNVKTSGPTPTHSGKTSSNEWVYTPIHPHALHTYTPTRPTHTHTPTHRPPTPPSDIHAPSTLAPPIPPKKISKAIYIAPPAFQENKSSLLPQKKKRRASACKKTRRPPFP